MVLRRRSAVDVDDRGRDLFAPQRFGVRKEEKGGNVLAVRAGVPDVRGLDERRRIDRGGQRARERARLDRPLARHEHVPRTRRAREHERGRITVRADIWRQVHTRDVRDGMVRVRHREDPAKRDRRILVVEIRECASVGAPDRPVLVVDAVGHVLDAPDLALGVAREGDLVPSARVGGERDPRAVGRPLWIGRLAVLAIACLEPGRLAAGRSDNVEVGIRPRGLAARPEHQERAVGRPSGLHVVPRPVGDRALFAGREVDHLDTEGLATGVRRVDELRAIRRPRDIAMHYARLVGEVALVLAVAIDQPDIELLIPTAIAQEGELPRIRRPPRPDRSLLRVRQLEDALAVERHAVDLERPRAVPRERDLASVR